MRFLTPLAIVGLVAALAFAIVSLAFRPATSQFVQRSELGMGLPALAESANAAVRAQLNRAGLTATRLLILRETVDGDHGTVVMDVRYGPPTRETEVTLIFHRSLWSLSEQTVSALPSS